MQSVSIRTYQQVSKFPTPTAGVGRAMQNRIAVIPKRALYIT